MFIRYFNNDKLIYLLTNLIFSGSTYLVTFFLPYLFNQASMAEFVSVYNVFLILLVVVELGISVSVLRYKNIYKMSFLFAAVWQLCMFLLLGILAFSNFGQDIIYLFFNVKIDNFNINLLYLALIAQFSWLYSKNWILLNSSFKFGFLQSVIILLFRFLSLLYFFTYQNVLTLNNILMLLFIFPFVISFLYITYQNIKLIKSYKNKTIKIKLYKSRIIKIILFALGTYVISALYILATRYPITYLTNNNYNEILSNIGYSFVFVGIVSLFISSLRNYYISKFRINNINEINKYLKALDDKFYIYVLFSFLFTLIIMGIVYIVKPVYIDNNSSIYVGIVVFSYSLIAYFGMITLVGKTINLNKIEIIINISRLVLVYLAINMIFPINIMIGLIVMYLIIILAEYILSCIIRKKISLLGAI